MLSHRVNRARNHRDKDGPMKDPRTPYWVRAKAKTWLAQHATPQILELLHEQLLFVRDLGGEDHKLDRNMVEDLYIRLTGRPINVQDANEMEPVRSNPHPVG